MLELKANLYWNGVLDPELRTFDIIMHTEFGTTYNSYVLKGSEKTALIETAKLTHLDSYLKNIASVTDVRSIDYIIVNHTEPDHAGSIERLVELNPNIKVVGTATAISFLKHIVNRDFYSLAVKDFDTLSLGDKTLQFHVLPNLHWPDSMYTYLQEDGVLFSCDSFGSHYSHEGILRSTVTDTEGYLRATKYYFDNILGPFKHPYMTSALERVEGMTLNMICPGHGPVLDSHIEELLDIYRDWCALPAPRKDKLVVIPYVSAYGYTRELALEIARGVEDCGGIEVRAYDLVEADSAAVAAELGQADGMLFGSPTILQEALAPIWSLVTALYPPLFQGKLASAFGSYGWSGEAVPNLIERLRQAKLNVPDDGFRVRFKPDANQLLDAYEYGYNFGCILQNRENDRKKKKDAAPAKVRCLVCGEVFDAGIDRCPVCGVGAENFVPVEGGGAAKTLDTDERFIILGSGAAAVNAAKAIRERNRTANIILISEEEVLPYNRPMLTKTMLAGFEPSQIAINDEKWYEEHNIIHISGMKIERIDTRAKEVICAGNVRFSYHKLIYALGARCFVPPMPGAELPEVVAIRGVKDVQKVQKLLPTVQDVVVIGGGVLGLEAAWELHKSGAKVTVVEAAPQIMGRQIDAGAAQMPRKLLSENSIELLEGVQTEAIVDAEGHVGGVKLSGGRVLDAQMVIVSCGIRANAEIAKAAGIRVERSVVVDAGMRTNVADVYACGDCAEFEGVNVGLWSQAVEMGTVAGANAAGDALEYEHVQAALTFNGLGTSLYAVGDCGKGAGKAYKTLEMRDEQRKQYEKLYFAAGRLCGTILIGDTSRMAELSEAVKHNAKFSDVVKG